MKLRTCTRCKRELPLKHYAPAGDPRYLSSWCRICKADYTRRWCAERAKRPGWRQARAEATRKDRLAKWGLQVDDYAEILEAQGGVCAGCLRQPVEGRSLDIDHLHLRGEKHAEPWERTVRIRGLLCHMCNRAVGMLRDDPARLRRLADYLERPPARPFLLERFRSVAAYLEQPLPFNLAREAE